MHWTGGHSRYHFDGGQRIHTLEFQGGGTLPPVVMMHGLGSCGVHYADLVRRLRGEVRYIWAPDMPGHGLSSHSGERIGDWERFRNALDARVDAPAMVFGNSLGGLSAIRYALERPERVLGLMLVSPAGARVSDDELRHFVSGLDLDSHAKALDFTDRLFVDRHPLRHLIALGVRARFARPGVRAILDGLDQADLLEPEKLAQLDMPIHFIWGGAERILPKAQADFFRAHLPAHTEFESPHSFGHAPFIDHPRQVAQRIRAFLERLDQPGEPSALAS